MQVTKTEIVDILTDIIGVLGILVSFQVVVMNMVPSKYLPYAIGFFAIISIAGSVIKKIIDALSNSPDAVNTGNTDGA